MKTFENQAKKTLPLLIYLSWFKKKRYATTLEVTFLFQKLENMCQKEKRRHRNFASELYGCQKN